MKHIKKFNEKVEEVQLTFNQAFEQFIKGKTVASTYSDRPLILRNNEWKPYYAYVKGVTFDNGYSHASHGGGCSGEDCNETFIISPENKVIASFDW